MSNKSEHIAGHSFSFDQFGKTHKIQFFKSQTDEDYDIWVVSVNGERVWQFDAETLEDMGMLPHALCPCCHPEDAKIN